MNQPSNTRSAKDHTTAERMPVRRSRIIFVIVMIITTLAVIWPGHAIFSSATPLIFGFPLSFAWIILWVIVGFAAMMGLYLSDEHEDDVNKDTF